VRCSRPASARSFRRAAIGVPWPVSPAQGVRAIGQGYICVSLLNSQNEPQSISFVTALFHYLTRRTLGIPPKEPARFAVMRPFVLGCASAQTIAWLARPAGFGGSANDGGDPCRAWMNFGHVARICSRA
jgi:hypothetical protein